MTITDLDTHPAPHVRVEELAEYWCVSVDTIYRDIRKGALPALRVGSTRLLRIPTEAARKYGQPEA